MCVLVCMFKQCLHKSQMYANTRVHAHTHTHTHTHIHIHIHTCIYGK